MKTKKGLALVIAAVIFFVAKKRKRLIKSDNIFNDSGVSSFRDMPEKERWVRYAFRR